MRCTLEAFATCGNCLFDHFIVVLAAANQAIHQPLKGFPAGSFHLRPILRGRLFELFLKNAAKMCNGGIAGACRNIFEP